MRILTVRQPWAWALIHAGKTVENRSRNIAGNYTGLVAIHAGLKADNWEPRTVAAWLKRTDAEQLSYGHIIGIAELTGAHQASACNFLLRSMNSDADHDTYCSQWAEPDSWHLTFKTHPHALAHPIPYRGKQGLTNLDPAVAKQLEREWMTR